jgi:SSS family solute:Na+ symporter
MKVIGYTDVIQVSVLIIGGLATTYVALTVVSKEFGFGENALEGFNQLIKKCARSFSHDLCKTRCKFIAA